MITSSSPGGTREPVVVLNEKHEKLVEDEGLIQLIIWSDPVEVIPSQYGDVDMMEYCRLEKERIEKGGDRVAVVIEQDGKVSLWVDEPYAQYL